MKLCPICGPKLSAFWLNFLTNLIKNQNFFSMIMSVWGAIFLGLLGLFFSLHAVTLFPDLHFDKEQELAMFNEP